jgi:ankyrin repeat protein
MINEDVNEYFIRPFDSLQRQLFFNKMIQQGFTEWKSSEEFEKNIIMIPGLNHLLTTPFMLRIVTEILPSLVKEQETKNQNNSQKISRALIYQAFMEREFQLNRKLLYQTIPKHQIPMNFDEILSFRKFSMNLAIHMFIARVSSVIDKGDDYRYFEEEDYFWDKFFHSSSLTLIASRFGCPLIALGRQRSFRHKSLLEYFTAARLLEILNEFEAVDQSTSSTSPSSLAGSDDLKANGLTESIRYFNSRPLHEEPSIVSFLLDMIHLQSNRKMIEEQLWKIIEASKHSSNLAIACGNAISLLVSLHASFAEKDCSGIHCQDAIFDNGNFMKTNFSHGTFIRSSWDGAILHETNFNEATFQETLIEERACLQPTIANTILDMITIDRYALIVGTNIGGVFIWKHGKLCYFSAKHAECSFASSPNQRWLVCRTEQEISLFDCQAIATSTSSTSITAQWNCSQIQDYANFFVNDEELIVSRRIENVADDATVKYQLISINLRENDVSISFLQETILQLPSLSTLIQLIPFDVMDKPSSEGNEENKKISYFLSFAIDSFGWRGLSYFERTGIDQWKRISFKVVSNLIESMKAIIRIPSSPFFLYKNGRNILELRSIDCLENPFFWNPSLPLSLQENPIDEYVLSPSGQFLLIRIYRTVTVYQVLVESSSSIQFQFLYELNNISSCLAMNQFHSSEQYIAFGCDSVIRVMKSKEMKIVQELSLIDPNVIKEIHFSQELFLADENRTNLDEESGEDILLIRQDGNHELLRRRFDPDELWEEKHPSLTSSSLTATTSFASLKSSSALMSTSALRINSANAVDNNNDGEDDEDDVAEMSALGATFFNVKGLQVEDQMLMTERGGRFIPEEEMISKYQSTYDAQERLSILIAALRCCYKQFFKTVDWDRNLRLDENLQTTIDQYLILHSRSNSQDYYIEFLTYLISLGLELNHTNERGLTGFILAARKGFLKFMQFYMNQLPSLDINQQAVSDGWSALFYAAKNGRKEVCEYLLTLNGIQIEQLDVDGTPPLATAAIYGHLNVVRVLLEASANVHHVDTCDGANALHRACQYGFYDIAEIVISYGIDVNVPRTDNFTPLTIAAQNGFYEICELLLTNGASTASVDNKFPLYYAAENGHSKIVQLLLDHQANVFDRLQCGYTAVHGASICGHATILEMLLSHGAESNPAMTVDEYKPIYQAAQNGFVQSCQILIKYGANPSELMPNHYSAFMIATQNGHNDLLRYFLKECGCSLITDRNENGFQPLYIAADWNYMTMVKLFLEESPEVVNEGKFDELLNIPRTPLSVAVLHGYTPIVEYLISKGAKILTEKDNNGRNVLYVAAAQNNLALVEVILKQLVAQGDEVVPFILETGNDGYNAFFHAVWNGFIELVQLFLNHGVSIHVGNQNGFQAIYLATESNQNKMVEFLLQQGASVLGRVDEDGDNPSVAYKKAKENQNQFLCDLFVQYGAKYD